eukprot:2979532-Prymnesium_polylepis.1
MEAQTTINILGEDFPEINQMMFFEKQLTENNCYVLDEAPDGSETQVASADTRLVRWSARKLRVRWGGRCLFPRCQPTKFG